MTEEEITERLFQDFIEYCLEHGEITEEEAKRARVERGDVIIDGKVKGILHIHAQMRKQNDQA